MPSNTNSSVAPEADQWSDWQYSQCLKNDSSGEYSQLVYQTPKYNVISTDEHKGRKARYETINCDPPMDLQIVKIIAYSVGGVLVLISLICAFLYVRKRILRKRAKESLLVASYSKSDGSRVCLPSTSSEVENDLYYASIPSPTWHELNAARRIIEDEPRYEAILGGNEDGKYPTRNEVEYAELSYSSKTTILEENDIYNVYSNNEENLASVTTNESPHLDPDENDYYAEIKK